MNRLGREERRRNMKGKLKRGVCWRRFFLNPTTKRHLRLIFVSVILCCLTSFVWIVAGEYYRQDIMMAYVDLAVILSVILIMSVALVVGIKALGTESPRIYVRKDWGMVPYKVHFWIVEILMLMYNMLIIFWLISF